MLDKTNNKDYNLYSYTNPNPKFPLDHGLVYLIKIKFGKYYNIEDINGIKRVVNKEDLSKDLSKDIFTCHNTEFRNHYDLNRIKL